MKVAAGSLAFILTAVTVGVVLRDQSPPRHAKYGPAVIAGDGSYISDLDAGVQAALAQFAAEDQAVADEQARQDALEAAAQQRPQVEVTYPPECYGRAISPAQLWRESHCSTDPGLQSPPSFCSGRGCVGPYQIDNGHFAEQSPWNSTPGVHGSCYGLDPSTLTGQEACAARLGPGAWG